MRVLITGGSGFAGFHLTQLCAERGATVVGLGRRPAGDVRLPDGIAEYIQADLTVAGEAERAIDDAAPDCVFHLAAAVSVARSWAEPRGVLRDNYLSTLNLLEAIRGAGGAGPVVLACSSEEYGAPERLPVTEDAPLQPRNPYAASKAAADVLAGFHGDAYGLHVIRTRAFNHAGPGQPERYVVSALARQIAMAERSGADEVTVTTGNPDARRDFVDVRDVARAYWAAAEQGEATVYNVCTGRSASAADILARLAEHTSLSVHQRTDPGLLRENEVMDIFGSHERLSRATGWAPEVEFSVSVRDTLDWWRRVVA